MTVREAAAELSRSEWSVRDYVRRGFLPAFQIGRGRMEIHPDDLGKFRRLHLRDPRHRSVLRRAR